MQYGRKEIFTDAKEITKENICDVVMKAMPQHLANKADIKELRDIEKGKQDILKREKEVRPEINNKVTENHATEVTTFKVGYVFGSPVTYVQRANKNGDGENSNEDDNRISLLNEMLFEESKTSKDQQLARDFNITGVGYRMALPKLKSRTFGKSVFDLITLNPETTFIIKQNNVYKTKLLGCSYSVLEDGKYRIGAYTDDYYYELESDSLGLTCKLVGEPTRNGIGLIPIIEYINSYDRTGCFEKAIPLINAINIATSDRINGLAQFIQSIVWMNNCEVDEEQFEKLQEMGGLCTKDSNDGPKAEVKILVNELNQADTQTVVDDLYDKILQICCVPGREASTGGNTGQAILLSNGWQLAETAAKNTEMIFSESERELLKVIISIISKKSDLAGTDISKLKISDIDIKFTRNRTDGLLVKTQALQGMLASGIHPLVAIDACGLFSDPQQVWNDSKPYIERINSKDATKNVAKIKDREVNKTQNTVEKPKNTKEVQRSTQKTQEEF